MAAPRIELITRGDDSGASCSANRAVRQCFREGVLRNTSMMAIGDGVEDAAKVLADCDGLSVGYHVALNSEWTHPRFRPVLPPDQVSSLLEADGCFRYTPHDTQEHGLDLDEAMAEVAAQLQRLRSLGLKPEYLDEHMGVGRLEGLGDRLAEFASQEGLLLVRDNAKRLPRGEGDVSDDPVQAMIDRLEAVPQGRYFFVTHPLVDDEEARAITNASNPPGKVARERDGDRLLLIDPRLKDYCDNHGVKLTRYVDPTELPRS